MNRNKRKVNNMNLIEEVMRPYEEFVEYLDNEVFKDFKKEEVKKEGESNGFRNN